MGTLGDFMGGFQDGVDTRHKWKDRKRQQALDDEDREWMREDRVYTQEERQYTREERARVRAEQDRLAAEAAAERQAAADAFEASKLPTSRSVTSGPNTTAPDGGVARVGDASLSFGLPAMPSPALPNPRSIIPMPNTTAPEAAAIAEATPQQSLSVAAPPVPAPASARTAGMAPTAGTVQPEEPQAEQAPVSADTVAKPEPDPRATRDGPSYEDWREMSRAERKRANLPVSEIGGQIHFGRFAEGLGIEHTPDQIPQRAQPEPPMASKMAAAQEAQVATVLASDRPAPGQDPAEWKRQKAEAARNGTLEVDPERVARQAVVDSVAERAMAMPAPPPRPAPRSIVGAEEMVIPANVAPPGTPPARAVAASNPAAAVAPGATPAASPSVQAATATAPVTEREARTAIGFGTPVKVTKEEEDQAVGSFMDNYLKEGVPKMVEYYLSTGQIDKAKAFDDWAQEEKVQGKMRMWAAGVHSAAIGDEQGMFDNFAEYYNSFDDGLTVIREKSGFRRDAEGNTVGIDLTFRDDKTGAVFTQNLDGTEELLHQGIYALAPEKMFEVLWGQMEQAQEIERDGLNYERDILKAVALEAAKVGVDATPKRVAAAMKQLEDTGFGFADLPPDQKIAAVVERIAAEDAATAAIQGGVTTASPTGDLPVYR